MGRPPGIRHRIDGELVPVLHAWLDGTLPIYFEHPVVLWKDPPIFLTEAQGPGERIFA